MVINVYTKYQGVLNATAALAASVANSKAQETSVDVNYGINLPKWHKNAKFVPLINEAPGKDPNKSQSNSWMVIEGVGATMEGIVAILQVVAITTSNPTSGCYDDNYARSNMTLAAPHMPFTNLHHC